MTGEPTNTTSKETRVPTLMFLSECAPQLSITDSKVKWPLHFTFSYVQSVTQHQKQRTLESSLQVTENMDNFHLQMYSREAIMCYTLDCQQKEMGYIGGQR